MADMWFKRCPQCGTYMKKLDPQDSSMCCACGWEEYVGAFYCDVVNRFCRHLSEDYRPRIDLPREQALRKSRH